MAVEWLELPFPEAIDFQEGPGILAKDFRDVGVPLIRLAGLDRSVSILTGCDFLDPRMVADRWAHFALQKGDILLSSSASLGRIAVVNDEAIGAIPYTGIIRMRPRDDRLVPPFIRYLLEGPDFQRQAEIVGVGSVIRHFGPMHLRQMVVRLPSQAEQIAITYILGTLDDKIELNRRMNETLEAMAQALFKSWFVDFDPVRAKLDGRDVSLPNTVAAVFPKSFRQSQFGNLPDGWRLSSLGDEAQRCGGTIQTGPFGSQLHASDYAENGVPVIMPQDLSRRRVLTAKIARVNEGDAERLGRHRVRQGDIVYSRRGDVERHALIGERETGWLCGTGCLLVRLGKKFPSPFFASLSLDLAETRAWIVQHAIGATMPNLNTGILSRVPFLVPGDALLDAFENALQPLAKRIVENDRNAEVLSNVRDTLLPKLISGELRVKTAEKIVEAVA